MLRAGIASTPVTTTTAIAAGQRKRVTHPDQARATRCRVRAEQIRSPTSPNSASSI